MLLFMPQDETFIAGVVTDKRGNELPKAAVQLENQRTMSVESYITGADGRFRFHGLLADVDYSVRAKYRDHWSNRHFISKFDSAKKNHEIHLIIPVD